jgi:hypothetical protein
VPVQGFELDSDHVVEALAALVDVVVASSSAARVEVVTPGARGYLVEPFAFGGGYTDRAIVAESHPIGHPAPTSQKVGRRPG